MMRSVNTFLLGLLATFGLFVLMNSLISGGSNANDTSGSSELQDFVRVARESKVQEKERVVPKRPEMQKRPVSTSQATQQQQMQGPQFELDLPKIDVPLGTGGGGVFVPIGGGGTGGAGGFGDGDLIPWLRVDPQYPREAALEGVSGYVVLSFTVMEDGTVQPGTVKVIEAKPPRVFDSAAMRAVARWKFKPRIVEGKPVKRAATQRLDFSLEKEEGK